jgi:hypothetical protein
MVRTILTTFLYLPLALGVSAEAQQASVPNAIFYAAPDAADNPACSQTLPCSPQGAVMACQAQWIYLCPIFLADGLYYDPAVNVFHYKFIEFFGNRVQPQNVVFRATRSSTCLIQVQDHATMSAIGLTLDSADGVTGVIGICGRQHVIIDYGIAIFGALPGGMHVNIAQFSIATCTGPVSIIGGGPLRNNADTLSQANDNCPIN